MKILFFLITVFLSLSCIADDYVKPYVRSDGNYVQGHYRTSPNSTNLDNYSTRGNVNPYTGKAGTVKPDYEGYSSKTTSNKLPSFDSSPKLPTYGEDSGEEQNPY